MRLAAQLGARHGQTRRRPRKGCHHTGTGGTGSHWLDARTDRMVLDRDAGDLRSSKSFKDRPLNSPPDSPSDISFSLPTTATLRPTSQAPPDEAVRSFLSPSRCRLHRCRVARWPLPPRLSSPRSSTQHRKAWLHSLQSPLDHCAFLPLDVRCTAYEDSVLTIAAGVKFHPPLHLYF